ncbi:unnamed protein product [Urochloa humidicola]
MGGNCCVYDWWAIWVKSSFIASANVENQDARVRRIRILSPRGVRGGGRAAAAAVAPPAAPPHHRAPVRGCRGRGSGRRAGGWRRWRSRSRSTSTWHRSRRRRTRPRMRRRRRPRSSSWRTRSSSTCRTMCRPRCGAQAGISRRRPITWRRGKRCRRSARSTCGGTSPALPNAPTSSSWRGSRRPRRTPPRRSFGATDATPGCSTSTSPARCALFYYYFYTLYSDFSGFGARVCW